MKIFLVFLACLVSILCDCTLKDMDELLCINENSFVKAWPSVRRLTLVDSIISQVLIEKQFPNVLRVDVYGNRKEETCRELAHVVIQTTNCPRGKLCSL